MQRTGVSRAEDKDLHVSAQGSAGQKELFSKRTGVSRVKKGYHKGRGKGVRSVEYRGQ